MASTKNTRLPRSASKRSPKQRAKRAPSKTPAAKPNPNVAVVLSWEDDPASTPPRPPVKRPVPNLDDKKLAIKISGPKPAPKIYPKDVPAFRYWAAAEQLRRVADFWSGIVPASFKWQVGTHLPVHLDVDVDLNAFYSRGSSGDQPGLNFFHEKVNGVTYYSGESPEVTCHEFGHAVLDGLAPSLFDAAFDEVAAFHESFGDMSAILSVLQLESIRTDVIEATGGKIYRNSCVSRIGEQLGFAIRQNYPDGVDSDCMRNAVNSFFYRDPQSLPPRAPANLLSSEPHSFSRVFTGAFLEILAGIFLQQGPPGSQSRLLDSTNIAGTLLANAVLEAAIVPAYFSQVAAQFLSVDATKFGKKYRDAIKGAFVRRGILSLEAASSGVSGAKIASTARAFAATEGPQVQRRSPLVAVNAARFGIEKSIWAEAPGMTPRFAVAAAGPAGEVPAPTREKAVDSFLGNLFSRGRIDMGEHGDHDTRVSQPRQRKTHDLVAVDNGVKLQRRMFDCGFDAG